MPPWSTAVSALISATRPGSTRTTSKTSRDPPRRREPRTGPRMPRRCGRQTLGNLPCLVRAQGCGAADSAQPAGVVVAAEDEELRAGEGAGDATDDRFGGIPTTLVK